ncbi:nucleotide-diphospho-sugar transferase [Lobosporangium transversale]|uniref:Nucleotide-diphospho-sugar transferase n=1 Tax=Lobosporangium transversale TaxID=64571 RepID=A0A1Y2GWX0_9FUNG|nr:nucleotide-diphospho-sugar transferase [Lobosporangium transversale]ORZ26271.1 nucleotide-diphospho-sugar transferase [Lobosporangium transversale]|eukprot:XP_021884036.1 nucleotide-diphospho-sugar transferase [Lobosporangium transversale]
MLAAICGVVSTEMVPSVKDCLIAKGQPSEERIDTSLDSHTKNFIQLQDTGSITAATHVSEPADRIKLEEGKTVRNVVTLSKPPRPIIPTRKAKATFMMLVRNEDLYGALRTVQQIEDRFNYRYEYPYVFLNDKPFSGHFKEKMRKMSKAEMVFAQIPHEHWSYPAWISQKKAAETRERMKNVIYGSSESYRHMCRFQSGFVAQHEALLAFDYFWRIEPDVKYSCDVDFDPFLYMHDNNKKYAFTISLYEYSETIRGLWNATKIFMERNPQFIARNNALSLISDDKGGTYNNCHFWSNFEIVDARWMRSEAFQAYFDHLDHQGGFFYERWGDAPVHTIAAVLLLPINQIHFFREIGYYHEPFHNCPAEPHLQLKCHCDPELNANLERFTCTSKFLDLAGEERIVFPEEVDD